MYSWPILEQLYVTEENHPDRVLSLAIHDYKSHPGAEYYLSVPLIFLINSLCYSSRWWMIILHIVYHVYTHRKRESIKESFGCILTFLITTQTSCIYWHIPYLPSRCLSNWFSSLNLFLVLPSHISSCRPGISLRCLLGRSNVTCPNRTLDSVCFFATTLQHTNLTSLPVFLDL